MNGEVYNKRNKIIITLVTGIFSFLMFYGLHYPRNTDFVSEISYPEATTSASILIVGDMMLDRNVRNTINRIGFDEYFAGVKDLVQSVDFAVVNLEGAFTLHPSKTASLKNKVLEFTFDPGLAPALSNLGFDVLGLANNHSFNFGRSGLESTRRYIGSSGMLYYGDPFNLDEISTVVVKNGIKIGFIGFHEFYYVNSDKVLAEILRLRSQVDVLIVTPHWGIEYNVDPTTVQTELAHQYIDAGADAVIGAHSHVVGKIEDYKGKKIYYSLGNFAFDQYFSEATMNGLGVILNIKKNKDVVTLNYTNVPIKVNRDGVKTKL